MTRIRVLLVGVTAGLDGVARLHRHLPPPPGALVAFEVRRGNGMPCGWATVGRPASRVLASRGWVEVTRVATDGEPHACSALYGAAARWARRRGSPIVTYTRMDEPGTSLLAAGWACTGITRPRRVGWANRRGRRNQPAIGKRRWSPPWCAEAKA